MKGDETIGRRLLASYQLMLDFFGMRLENESTGLISRSTNYEASYKNLRRTCLSVQTPFLACPRIFPCALRDTPLTRNPILFVRSPCAPEDKPIVGPDVAL
jgi:hypothetical protein